MVVHNRRHTRLFGVEHARRAGDVGVFKAADLGYRALSSEVARQNGEVALRVFGRLERQHHVLTFGRRAGYVPKVFGDGFARDAQAVAVQKTVIEQHLHDERNPADPVQVGRYVLARRFEVDHVRGTFADMFKVLERQLDIGSVRDGEQVQHGVRRAADSHHDGNAVFKRLFGHDLARCEVVLEQLEQRRPARCGARVDFVVFSRHRRRVGQAHSHRFKRARHGVGGVHTAA